MSDVSLLRGLNLILVPRFLKYDLNITKIAVMVFQSNGIGQTRMLAEFHFQEAQRQMSHFKASDAGECLLQVAATILLRNF